MISYLPTSRPDCRLGETRRGMVYCWHYTMSTMIDHDERPEYCQVEKITIEEGRKGDNHTCLS